MSKSLDLDLTSVDGNAYSLIAFFIKEARRAGWSKEEIEKVKTEAMSGDYDHLIQTLLVV